MPYILKEPEISILDCEKIATKKFKTPSWAMLGIEYDELNYISENQGGVLHSSWDTIVYEGSKVR